MFIKKIIVLSLVISYNIAYTTPTSCDIKSKLPQGNSAYMAQPTPRKANCFKRTTEELYEIGTQLMHDSKKELRCNTSTVSTYIQQAHKTQHANRRRTWVMAEPYGRNKSKYTRSRSKLYELGTQYLRNSCNKNKPK